MKIQYAILYMNVGQPSRLKYQWGSLLIPTHVSVGHLYPSFSGTNVPKCKAKMRRLMT